MTEQEYNLEIEHCQETISGGDAEETFVRLESLYKIKPIRLNWYVAKAGCLWKTTKKKSPLLTSCQEKGGT